ncbi:MAG: response regulator [Actinobacteria bacterium]|nr:response regulator [Actinomycetota bacterium]MCG2818603.1 response regulator [Actinomycetes bacterium]MBU4218208.1 response regulator [Actinomycetota bacterium]MBU4392052.1 response regulator [Actinomycetota bacterium]MBU4402280.1 response regulator [Actinomycetota bacterium]
MPELKKRKVLLIDDEVPLLEVMKTNLQIEGYDVVTEMSGETGLVSAFVDEPDVIILDIMMPDVDGWEICERLRSDARTKYVPIIMLTALDEAHHVVKGFECGADDYLAKPFDNAELFARIKSVLTKASKGMAVDPLTKLPGKHQIYEETRKRLERRGKFFAFIYVDIGNLRLVNYRYGVNRGDSLITSLAGILRDVVIGDKEFLGYMGEDDFVMLSVPLRVNQIFSTITARFDEALREICPEMEDEGDPGEGSTIKIDMAVVTNEKKQFGDPLQVKNAALEVLKTARGHPGHYCANLKNFPV